ncbi:MAG: glycosyltransferase [Pseudomonadota bacterium]
MAFTICSRNYFAFARTLATSYRRCNPKHDVTIVLVDVPDERITQWCESNGVRLLSIFDLSIPNISTFILSYSIIELNTAVKPFAFQYFFDVDGYARCTYLDPDIGVYRPLLEVDAALDDHDIVLTPHITRPFYDTWYPGELDILSSGTFNLGFLALKASGETHRFVDWWATKLHTDCVVELERGVFVDQKWVDFAPSFFTKHFILKHPGYNIAYWNLHERTVEGCGERLTVNGSPLVFFHFSGFDPFLPHRLSKHQTRFVVTPGSALAGVCSDYAATLLANGHEASCVWTYGLDRLSNGVTLPLKFVSKVVRHCVREGVEFPDPGRAPDAFCRFLADPRAIPTMTLPPIVDAVLSLRKDVARAYRSGIERGDATDVLRWMANSGRTEEGLDDLLPYLTDAMAARATRPGTDTVGRAFERLWQAGRTDVLEAFEGKWFNEARFAKFADWFTLYGVDEMGFDPAVTAALKDAFPSLLGIVHLYFEAFEDTPTFANLEQPDTVEAFCNRLRSSPKAFGLRLNEIALFEAFALANRSYLERVRFLYSSGLRGPRRNISLYDIDARAGEVGLEAPLPQIASWLSASEERIAPDEHLIVHGLQSARRPGSANAPPSTPLSAREAFRFHRRAQALVAAREGAPPEPLVNVAGYFDAPTGIGEAGRAVRDCVAGLMARTHTLTLPTRTARGTLPADAFVFGWPRSEARLSIAVANADAVPLLERFAPPAFWGEKRVGVWAWETERLPEAYAQSADPFDEVWAGSAFSAAAIEKTIDKPVHIVPLTVDFAAIAAARADRPGFGLPESRVLYGYMFDPKSVLERKNVHGLLDAFAAAMRDDDQATLVLKSSVVDGLSLEYQRIRARVERMANVELIEKTMTRAQTMSFLASLDVYVSLHRAEGFGLTCAEAMAAGVPVIASRYSANLDFMSDADSLLVATPTVVTQRPYGPYRQGTVWGDPDLDDAGAKMRQLLPRRERLRVGALAKAAIARRLGRERIETIYQARLSALLDDEAHAAMVPAKPLQPATAEVTHTP